MAIRYVTFRVVINDEDIDLFESAIEDHTVIKEACYGVAACLMGDRATIDDVSEPS